MDQVLRGKARSHRDRFRKTLPLNPDEHEFDRKDRKEHRYKTKSDEAALGFRTGTPK
jgi:hypothetical protein